jgi:hypothetical protein
MRRREFIGHLAQSGAFLSNGSRGWPASTIIVHPGPSALLHWDADDGATLTTFIE